MKPFHFPLDGVFRWREKQSEQEDEKLSRLLAELNRFEMRKAENEQARVTASKSQLQSEEVSGSDFRALGAYLAGLHAAAALLQLEVVKCTHRVKQQQASCVVARRSVKLLELLRAKKIKAWQHETDLKLEAAAAENYLARRARNLSSGT